MRQKARLAETEQQHNRGWKQGKRRLENSWAAGTLQTTGLLGFNWNTQIEAGTEHRDVQTEARVWSENM